MSWLQQQNKERTDYIQTESKFDKYKKKVSEFLESTVTREWLFVILFALLVPFVVYFIVVDKGIKTTPSKYTCMVHASFRVPCGKYDVTESECLKVDCCYDDQNNTCYHYLPSKYTFIPNENGSYKPNHVHSTVGTKSVENLQFIVNEIDENVLSLIIKEKDNETIHGNEIDKKNYFVNLSKEKLQFEVLRKDSQDLLLTTVKGPLIASKNYWEITLFLNSTLFGLNQTLITSNFTKVIYKNKNDHYTIPTFLAYRNGSFHSVTIKNNGPIELKVLPSHLIVLRSLIGEKVDIEVALGPTPADLHKQLAVEYDLPPLWTLEPLSCKNRGKLDLNKIVEDFELSDYSKSDCIDHNLLMAIIQDNNTNFDLFVNVSIGFRESGKKFVLSLPPQIIADTIMHDFAEKQQILHMYNNETYIGKYLKKNVVYPDYKNENSVKLISEIIETVKTYLNVSFIDAFILNDNWPAEESFVMDFDSLPYISNELKEAMSYTLQWNTSDTNDVLHIKHHNSYGSYQIEALESYYASYNEKPIVMSPSKSLEQSEMIVIENVDTTWDNLAEHLSNVLFNSIIGNHLVSLPVCGDTANFDVKIRESLCVRWYLVAATMPLLRVSSREPWRQPGGFNDEYVNQMIARALNYRMQLLNIYYTILSQKQPVVRPMFYNFPKDNKTFNLKKQYMIGDRILVAHPLSSDGVKLQVYLPNQYKIWYDLWGGTSYNVTLDSWIELDIVPADFLMFIPEGTLIPLIVDDVIDLIVGLECVSSDVTCDVKYSVLLNDNYVDFTANNESVLISNLPYESCNYTLNNIKVYIHDDVYIIHKHNRELCNGTDVVKVIYNDDEL